MKRDRTITELMDDPDCNPVKLLRTYKQFGFVNRMFSSWNQIYKQLIRPHLKDSNVRYTLLDVGCGLMDNSKFIQKLASQDGFNIHVTGLDPNPTVHNYLKNQLKIESIHFIPSYLHEIDADVKYDFIISNHLIHHLEDAHITDMHSEIASRTNKVAIMNDINRSMLAYIGFSVIMLPYKGWTFIQADGRRSIKRSFQAHELQELLPDGWAVNRVFPFRLLTVYEAV